MKRLLGALLALAVVASPGAAQPDFKPDPGFRSLFNGKDLTGWYHKNAKEKLDGKTESSDKRFLVKDGAIVCDVGKGIKDLYTVEEFASDFVVKMEFRAGPKADSGVYIRGPQLQIRDFIRRGEQKQLKNFKDDGWNLLVITVKGTEATFTLNDEALKPDKMKVPAKGGVGLQAETGRFEYRHIQVKAADSAKGAKLSPAPDTRGAELLPLLTSTNVAQPDFKPDPGFRSLFNGKDLTGWVYKGSKEKLDGKTETPDKRIFVKDGVIVCGEGKGIKDLYTIEEFTDEFVLKVEFRAGLKADSGVYVRGNQLQVRDYIRRNEQKQLKKFKNDDWNLLEISVRNKVATLNGKKLDAKDQLEISVKDGTPTASLNGKPIPIANVALKYGPLAHCLCNGEFVEDMSVPVKGGIGLQAETGVFEYRHVQIKVLGGAKSANVSVPAPELSFTSFQGEGAAKKRLLLITESKGFVHGVVNRGKKDMCLVEKTFVELAQKNPFFEVDYSQDSRSVITGDNLKKYDAVFFYTTGELPLSDAQKSDLLAFVRSGKGFGGSHCATDTFYKWKEYGELIGGYFDGHPWHQKVKVIVEDQKHPATKHLGASFEITDEIYQFRTPYARDKLHVLMKLDMDSVKNQGKRADKDNALAWVREYGKGRVFYTALGHRDEVWNDPRFQQHVIGGLRFMFGMEK